MKKWLILFLLIPALAYGFSDRYMETATSISSSQTVTTAQAYFYGAVINTDGANSVTVRINDGNATTGPVVWPTSQFAATPITQAISADPPVYCYTNINVTADSAGSYTITIYKREQ